MEVQFDDLEKSDLFIDCIYKGGKVSNMSAEPFHKLIPGCENAGGFRKKLREDGSGKYAYVVLYTSMEELEWPDYLDEETGIFNALVVDLIKQMEVNLAQIIEKE